jgi:hypothetical protein
LPANPPFDASVRRLRSTPWPAPRSVAGRSPVRHHSAPPFGHHSAPPIRWPVGGRSVSPVGVAGRDCRSVAPIRAPIPGHSPRSTLPAGIASIGAMPPRAIPLWRVLLLRACVCSSVGAPVFGATPHSPGRIPVVTAKAPLRARWEPIPARFGSGDQLSQQPVCHRTSWHVFLFRDTLAWHEKSREEYRGQRRRLVDLCDLWSSTARPTGPGPTTTLLRRDLP